MLRARPQAPEFVMVMVALVVLAAIAGGAATGRAAEPPGLTVFGAADLTFALKELAPRFEKAAGVKVTLVLGSTGNLARQIEHGAPADLFFAANESFVDDLVARGAVIAQTRTLYAQGRLVLATPRASGSRLNDLRELAGPKVRRVAIANLQHAPYGKAAEQALRKVGVWDAVRSKLVYGENIRHTLQFLQTGAADAGIVALSVADVPEIESVPIDPALHAPLNQVVAVARRSARPEIALAFIQYVNGPEGRPIMKRYGFRLPGEF
jgi:molybdate transport system substrate-binding protein